jgi:pyrroloquinoline-quinone synthase
MSERVRELRRLVEQFDLNKHPFYVAWREGTLPLEKLVGYAHEYEGFVKGVGDAWDSLGMPHYGEEERRHHQLWLDFIEAVSGSPKTTSGATLPGTQALENCAKAFFSQVPEAAGALYAFEYQQPTTSEIKLKGLREHYAVGSKGERYFEEHAGKWEEVRDLEDYIEGVPEGDFARVCAACALMSAALWCALDSVWYGDGVSGTLLCGEA